MIQQAAAFAFVVAFWGMLARWNILLAIPGVVILVMIVFGIDDDSP